MGHISLDPDARVRAKNIDSQLLGRRVREARVRAGLTQTEVGGETISTAYISRIESGQRRPSPNLIAFLAERLDVPVEELLAVEEGEIVVDAELVARLTLELDYAELELKTGQHEPALRRADAVLAEEDLPALLWAKATLVRALALEVRGGPGDVSDAILALEDLVASRPDGLVLIQVFIALCRIYLAEGDLGRACDVGNRAADLVDEALLNGTTEGIQLSVTVACAHFDRGDLHHAQRMCERAIRHAEEINSPVARASAYWNSSVFYQVRGDVDSALPLAQKAVTLLEQAEDARHLVRLRAQLALLQLDLDPPEIEGALLNLQRTRQDMPFADLSSVDRARVDLIEAQARLLTGDAEEAGLIAEDCYRHGVEGGTPTLAAEARILQGRAAAHRDNTEAASEYYLDAVRALSGIGNDRDAAQIWFELGELLHEQGHLAEAVDAFMRAGASTGLHSRLRAMQPLRSSQDSEV